MLSFYIKSSQLNLYSVLNQIKYYLKKIPGLKHLSPSDSFRLPKLKAFVSTIGPIALTLVQWVKGLMMNLIALLISLFIQQLVIMILPEAGFKDIYCLIFVYLSIFTVASFYPTENSEKILIFNGLFHIPAKTILTAGIFIDEAMAALGNLLALLLINKILALPLHIVLLIGLYQYLSAVISNAANCYFFAKNRIRTDRLIFNKLVSLLLLIPILSINVIYKMPPEILIGQPLLLLVMVLLFSLSVLYLRNYSRYELIVSNLKQTFDPKEAASSAKEKAQLKQTVLKEEDYLLSKKHIGKDLSGYRLLNELFFQRHRRLILRPIRIKAAIIACVLVGLLVLPKLPLAPIQALSIEKYISAVFSSLPGYLPFLAYVAFFNESLTRVFFTNCDQALMHYDFYRRPKDLLKMFTLRLKKLILWNSGLFLLFASWLIGMRVIYRTDLNDSLILILQMASLWIFFSVHTLFVYYLFQPYNDDLELKHPIYQILNFLVYLICYGTLQLHPQGALVAPVFIAVSILYTLVALLLVYHFAPKSFKVRIRK